MCRPRRVLLPAGVAAACAAAGIPVAVTALSDRAEDLRHARLTSMAVVIGSEGQGVSRLVREKSDFIVSIPMYGHVNSFNVSTAAAVILAEASKQHRQKK